MGPLFSATTATARLPGPPWPPRLPGPRVMLVAAGAGAVCVLTSLLLPADALGTAEPEEPATAAPQALDVPLLPPLLEVLCRNGFVEVPPWALELKEKAPYPLPSCSAMLAVLLLVLSAEPVLRP